MPNHVKNRIELIGSIDDLDAIIKRFGTHVDGKVNRTYDGKEIICRKKGNHFDFCWMEPSTGRAFNRNGLDQIGIPDGYEIEINQSYLSFPDFKKVIPPPDNDPAYNDIPSQKVAKDSPNWWYAWNCEHWGTKWGGYSYEREAINVFTFETAWASAPKIIEAMSLAFPNVTIKYSWADEDTGHNCGRAVYLNGLLECTIPEGGSKEAYDLAFELRPDRAEDYELVGETYKYKEEE